MTFFDLAQSRTSLRGPALQHVQRLARTWRPLADLSFSDLLLLVPVAGEEGHRFVVLAQMRPTTAQTVYPMDLVGQVVGEIERPLLSRAWRTGEIVAGEATAFGSKERTRVQVIPVRFEGELVGLLARDGAVTVARRPGELERNYQLAFDRLARMVAEGSFPFAVEADEVEGARVGDGVIITDGDTRVGFASPNAVSSLHRMGIHANTEGQLLRDVGFDDSAPRSAIARALPVAEEIERGDVTLLVRVIPLLDTERVVGTLMTLRDITDVRRRDRMLMSKDATIREIHHRVKNNLQTIASLLRLQRRRLRSDEARDALLESERRIRSIAVVHETLSRESGDVVRFAEIVHPLVRVVQESVSSDDFAIDFSVDGDPGELPGEVATPLAVVLNELMQNAVDHAFGEPGASAPRSGHVQVHLDRVGDQVVLEVRDDGVGLPERFSLDGSSGLGLSIVQALVTGELGGSIEMLPVADGGTGTQVIVRVPVAMPRVDL